VKNWLLRIASTACIDELRRRQRHPHVSIDYRRNSDEPDQAYDLPDDVPGPEDLALRGELRIALNAELLQLPDDQRLAVVLCDIEGLAYEEIAAAMGTSLGTVKSRISRGRARLREALEGRPELFGDLVRHTRGTK
jgi:RNA polymerase sigma-70 factor (ECF subfamily)